MINTLQQHRVWFDTMFISDRRRLRRAIVTSWPHAALAQREVLLVLGKAFVLYLDAPGPGTWDLQEPLLQVGPSCLSCYAGVFRSSMPNID